MQKLISSNRGLNGQNSRGRHFNLRIIKKGLKSWYDNTENNDLLVYTIKTSIIIMMMMTKIHLKYLNDTMTKKDLFESNCLVGYNTTFQNKDILKNIARKDDTKLILSQISKIKKFLRYKMNYMLFLTLYMLYEILLLFLM